MGDDKKDAVNIGVTLSAQLIAASLTMIALVGAFVTFVLDKREVGWGYPLVSGGAFVCFVVSIYLGGKGIDMARKKGFEGIWDISLTRSQFGRQASFAFLGIFLFIASAFIGRSKDDDVKAAQKEMQKQAIMMQVRDSLLEQRVNKLGTDIMRLRVELDSFHMNGEHIPRPDPVR
jgi:hypothetical protein